MSDMSSGTLSHSAINTISGGGSNLWYPKINKWYYINMTQIGSIFRSPIWTYLFLKLPGLQSSCRCGYCSFKQQKRTKCQWCSPNILPATEEKPDVIFQLQGKKQGSDRATLEMDDIWWNNYISRSHSTYVIAQFLKQITTHIQKSVREFHLSIFHNLLT